MSRTVKLICIFAALCLLFALLPGRALTKAEDAKQSAAQMLAYNTDSRVSQEQAIAGALVMYAGSPYALAAGKAVTIDPADLAVTPVIKEGARLVPVRFIAESLGASVEWESSTLTVTIKYEGRRISLRQGSKSVISGNDEYLLDMPAEAIKGRTYAPLEGFAMVLGKEVFYDRGLIVLSGAKNLLDAGRDSAVIEGLIEKVNCLPAVGSYENLKALLEKAAAENEKIGYGRIADVMQDGATQTNQAAAAPSAAKSAAGGVQDFSATNVQVEGVDEADIVKTDGEYIYQVNKQRVIIAKAYPADEMKLESTINYDGGSFSPREMYLHDNKLAVIGSSYKNITVPMYDRDSINSSGGAIKKIYPPLYNKITTKAIIYDITDKSNVKKLREVELEGNYLSSRKIDGALYLAVRKNMGYYHIMRQDGEPAPAYRDTARGEDFVSIGYDSIRYFPDMYDTSYLLIAGIDLVDTSRAANIDAYLGTGQTVYASTENLYIAVSGRYRKTANTLVYKFSLKGGKASYLGKGEVPGTILNQFSMDENKGFFRIATTDEKINEGRYITTNNVYILDDVLGLKGKIEDLAPGERIYSVRFMGNRGYVVTFKTVDPLFVLDLKEPSRPSVLGALKIPGYSDYLHPYDENHIIGFGKDTAEISGGAFYLGMKLAIFDVSDVRNPKQEFTEMIGDRGTESDVLHNHKALLFSKDKNLLAFPVRLMEVKDKSNAAENGFPQYGQFTFQGAYVYNIDLAGGFRLKGRITHIGSEEYLKAGSDWYNSDRNVSRIIYIGDELYTLSNGMIKANSLKDLSVEHSITIP